MEIQFNWIQTGTTVKNIDSTPFSAFCNSGYQLIKKVANTTVTLLEEKQLLETTKLENAANAKKEPTT